MSPISTETEARVHLSQLLDYFDQTLAERDRISSQALAYVSDLKQLLQVRDRALQEVQQAERGKSRFLSNISHEFRTPLTTILGLSKLAEAKAAPNIVEMALPRIVVSAEHLLELVNDLITFSALNHGESMANAALTELLPLIKTTCVTATQGASKKGVGFRLAAPAQSLPTLTLDASKFARVLGLILDNAVKFTQTGEICVEIDTTPDQNHICHVTVTDTGIGIPAEQLNQLFTPFEQGEDTDARQFSGVGLGLSLARSLMHLMGGELEVSSTPQQGTTVRLSLPEEPPLHKHAAHAGKSNVLLMQPQIDRLTQDLQRAMHERDQAKGSIDQFRVESLMRLASAAELRDGETGTHIMRMGHYSAIIAQQLGKDAAYSDALLYASRLHDVGKIAIPDHILKKAGPLTSDEWAIMRKHPEFGATLLSESNDALYQMAAEVALNHHEKWDGSGYPFNLRGEAIPLSGRIVALADYFDALTMDRCYRPAMSDEKALAMVQENTGIHFDPAVVAAFMKVSGRIRETRDRINQGTLAA